MKFEDTKFHLKIEMLKAVALFEKGITIKGIDHNPIQRELVFTCEYWIADGPISNRCVINNGRYDVFERAKTLEDVYRFYELVVIAVCDDLAK